MNDFVECFRNVINMADPQANSLMTKDGGPAVKILADWGRKACSEIEKYKKAEKAHNPRLHELYQDTQAELKETDDALVDATKLFAQTVNKHRWIPVEESPENESRPVKYVVRVEWEHIENPFTWEEVEWWKDEWSRWNTGNTRITHYLPITLPG